MTVFEQPHADSSFSFTVPAYGGRRYWLIGATTRLIDSWSPGLEEIRLPPVAVDQIDMQVAVAERIASSSPQPRSLRGRFRRRRSPHRAPMALDGLALDLRHDNTGNIAHVAHNQIALAAAIDEQLRQRGRPVIEHLIVEARTPAYSERLIELAGYRCVKTDGVVTADAIRVRPLAEPHGRQVELLSGRLRQIGVPRTGEPVPSNLFVARRGSRSIRNHEQVEKHLQARGFVTVYMEDHPVERQIELMGLAEWIVGIHGANLSMISFRGAFGSPPPRMIELYGAGYIVGSHRMQMDMLGGDWVGVRGRVTPDIVRDLDQRGEARAHQASPFEIDLASIDRAFEMIEQDEQVEHVGD